MKKTKLIFPIGAMVFLLVSSDSFSQVTKCRPIEFVELESMDSNELKTKYCQIKHAENAGNNLAKIAGESAISMMELGSKVASDQFNAEAIGYSDDSSACYQESKRVLRILEKRAKKTVSPTCP